MNRLRRVRSRIRALFAKRKLDAEMDEEMRSHIEMQMQENIANGMTPEEARYAAMRQFGHVDGIKEKCREQREGFVRDQLSVVSQDVRFAYRQLVKNPGFASVAVLTLALGIGANTAMFTLGNALLFRGYPAENPQELVAVFFGDSEGNGTDNHSYPDYLDYRAETGDVLSGIAAFTIEQANLAGLEKTERICVGFVTDNYFSVLGFRPLLGRTFVPDENVTPGAHPVAVISESLWRHEFERAPDVLDRTVRVDDVVYTVIGVVPDAGTRVLAMLKVDVFVPAMMRDDPLNARGNKEFLLVGRLQPGVTMRAAQARFNLLAAQLAGQYPDEWTRQGRVKPLTVVPFSPIPFGLRGYASIFFGVLLGLGGIVLLIVCANLAGLLLSRGAARRREMAVRLALGAGRGRLLRQLLTENLLLSLIGGAASLPMALWGARALTGFAPDLGVPLLVDVSLDARVLIFNLAVACGAALAFGLAPALQGTRRGGFNGLKEGGHAATAGGRHFSLRNALVIGQVAVSLVLLLCAGMLLRSLGKVTSINLGFDHEHLALLSVDLSRHGYSTERGQGFYAQAIERLQTSPGVEAVDAARRVPFSLNRVAHRFLPEEGPLPLHEANVAFNLVGPRYFETLNIPILLGRDFAPEDRDGSPHVAVINEAMAKRCWPGQNAIGKRLLPGGGKPIEVIGVCRTAKFHSLKGEQTPVVYLPWTQQYTPALTFHVRTARDPGLFLMNLQGTLRDLDPQLAVFDAKTMTEHLAETMLPVRLGATLLGIFSGVALGLAALGLYGVMAYTVTQRTREIGVCMALGAQRRNVLQTILGAGLKLTFIGIAFGSFAGAAATAVIARLLYGISSNDVMTLAFLTGGLIVVAAVACWFPARRATRIEPMEALRCE